MTTQGNGILVHGKMGKELWVHDNTEKVIWVHSNTGNDMLVHGSTSAEEQDMITHGMKYEYKATQGKMSWCMVALGKKYGTWQQRERCTGARQYLERNMAHGNTGKEVKAQKCVHLVLSL